MPHNQILVKKKNEIIIIGAREHNLKNISVNIPRNKLVVITGVSGSGKSSLAFDTLYTEGQRRYVESLSAYARQFLGRLEKPDVDQIHGIAPAVAVEQKVINRNPRSTVGSTTEIYDYLKLLFARIGRTISPISGNEVSRSTVTDVVDFINQQEKDKKVALYAPLSYEKGTKPEDYLKLLLQQGYTRIKVNNETLSIENLLQNPPKKLNELSLLIDRFSIKPSDEQHVNRIADSVSTAFYEGHGSCLIELHNKNKEIESLLFSNKFALDGMEFEEPSEHFFDFNSPLGACKTCEGFGSVIGIDEDLVVPDKSLSIYEDAIVCWKGEKMQEWKEKLVMNSSLFDFPIHKPFYELTKKQKELLWTGNKNFWGLNEFFKYLEENAYKIQYRVMLSRYRGKTPCHDCEGSRIRKDAHYVKINNTSIIELANQPVEEVAAFFDGLSLEKYEIKIANRLIQEITNRLSYLKDVGLGYLTLMRKSNTLSGGESQRIHLATSLGSSLVGSLYVLDEPSIGLHPRDTHRLIKVLFNLKKLGNSVLVVEHDEEIMNASDQLIDIGPLAGTHGGEIVFQGKPTDLQFSEKSITKKYLSGELQIATPKKRRAWKHFIEVVGVRENNLKNFSVKIPLGVLTVITGVSGSGKSSLVKKIIYPAIKKLHGAYSEKPGEHDKIDGDLQLIKNVEFIDQNPIGKSSRSNPVTYLKAYDEIRTLFSQQPAAKANNFKPSFFSFNVEGGRCEVCEGEGYVRIEMQFMADVKITCDACKGKKFKDEVLEVKYREKNIFDILSFTVSDAIDFFSSSAKPTALEKKIALKLSPLLEVGMGYVQLGQASSTLSGGEAQRIKLATFLSKGQSDEKCLFIFDEPTTGLHFHDINKLLKAFDALIDLGHSLLIVEHNLDVVKCADYVIDLGPEAGDKGGNLVFEGTPEGLMQTETSLTGKYLKEKILMFEKR